MKGYTPRFSDEEKEVETRGFRGLGNTKILPVGSETIEHKMRQHIKISVEPLINLGNVYVVDGVHHCGG